MERMVDPRVQGKLHAIGVEVMDSKHRFRGFLDILGDMAPALDRMNQGERSAFLLKTFGTEALGGVNAMLTQITGGIKTNTGVTVKGAEAIKYLRDQFENAGGTAAKFREQMLNTFEGQKKLLRGSMETLAIVAGEPFAQVFKPIVGVVVSVVNSLLVVFRGLPAPIKKAFAMFTVIVGTLLSIVGAVISAKASVGLLAIGLKAVGVTFGGFAATLTPAIVAVGLLAVAIAGLVLAFRNNLGGIADYASEAWGRITLGFQGLVQLFEQGGFSGAVRNELNQAENLGLKAFLINVYLWGNRIRNLLSGIATGFSQGIEAARPSIDVFVGALRRVGLALGFLSEQDSATVAGAKFERFGSIGVLVGKALATAFEFLVQVMTIVARVAEGVANGWHWVTAGAGLVSNALTQLGVQFSDVMNYLTATTSASSLNGSAWSMLGSVISFVIGLIVTAIGILVSAVSAAVSVISAAIQATISVFSGLADVVTGVVFMVGGIINGRWSDIWTGMKLVVFGVVDAIMGAVFELGGAVAGVIDSMAGLFGSSTKMQVGVRAIRDAIRNKTVNSWGLEDLSFSPASQAVTPIAPGPGSPVPATGAMPAVAAARAAAAQPPPTSPSASQGAPQTPVVVQLQVDGQTLATAVHRADKDNATRSFSPVPSY
jgi:phage-related protein